MRKALAEAEQAANEDEIPIGAIVTCRGRIIARTHNLTETLNDVTAHAEMQAITAAANALGGKYLQGCTIYVTVEPCPMCAGAIINARIPRVVFGSYDYKAGSCRSIINLFELPYNHTKRNVANSCKPSFKTKGNNANLRLHKPLALMAHHQFCMSDS